MNNGVFRCVLDGAQHGVAEPVYPHTYDADAGDIDYIARYYPNIFCFVSASALQYFFNLLFSGNYEAKGGIYRVCVKRTYNQRNFDYASPRCIRCRFIVACHAGYRAASYGLCGADRKKRYKSAAFWQLTVDNFQFVWYSRFK